MRIQQTAMLLISVVLLTLLSGAVLADQPALELRMTYNPMPFNLPSMVERQEGYLADEGFSVSYNTFLVGYAMTEAMAAGAIDVAPVMGATSAITSFAGGRDIRIIGAYSQASQGFALVGRPGENRAEHLAGARIGAPVGTEAHYLLAQILAEKGMSLNDVELIHMMVPDAVAALQTGEIEAAVIVDPVLTRLVVNEVVEVVRDGEGLIAGLTVSVVRADVEPDIVAGFRRAHERSLEFIEKHPDKALALAEAETELPEAMVRSIAAKYSFVPELDESIMQALESTADFLLANDIIRNPVSIEDVLYAD